MRGWIGKYCPELAVRHHHGRKEADLVPLINSYAISRGEYHMRLLLKNGRFKWLVRWLAKSVLRVPYERRSVFWEQVGAMRYAYVTLAGLFLTDALNSDGRES